MMKKLALLSIAACSASIMLGVQQFGIDGYKIVCKTGQSAREVGDFPIENPLQFQYTTQDSYSCLVIQLEAKPIVDGGAKAVVLNFSERFKRDPATRKSVAQTPVDLGYAGNYQFMYITRGPNGENLYGFVDYGNNANLKTFLEAIKQSANALTSDEKTSLQTKAPAAFKIMQDNGATLSE